MTKPYILLNDDCLNALKKFPDNSIEAVCTDPPYGLSKQPDIAEVMQHWINGDTYEHKSTGFMGNSWDSFCPGPEYWREVLRVLKPGGHAVVFAGSRTQDLMSIALRFAGFEIRETIMWVYGSGMPKSHDVSKAIDKMGGKQIPDGFASWLKSERESKGISAKDLCEMGKFYKNVNHGGLISNWESGLGYPNAQQFNLLCELLNLPFEKREEVEREILGWRKVIPGVAFSSDGPSELPITAPATDQAKQWQGWGSALKPAYEPIILVRKPLEGTIAQNVLKWGCGGINIDECRVELANEADKAQFEFNHAVGTRLPEEYADKKLGLHDGGWMQQVGEKETPTGRWPANICHDGSDEVVEMFPESGSGNGKGAYNYAGREYNNKDTSMFNGDKPQAPSNYNETGSAARFFYSSKATKKDRGEGNNHPTVKPVKLMEWLVKMVTPKNGKCLDPFMGSGSTGVAALNTGRKFIGIEMDSDYYQIAQKRLCDADEHNGG